MGKVLWKLQRRSRHRQRNDRYHNWAARTNPIWVFKRSSLCWWKVTFQPLEIRRFIHFKEPNWKTSWPHNRDKVAACAKHFVGDGGTTRGINENNTVISRHGLLSIHMPGYYHSIIKGVSTIMVSYSSWNGKKMHSNHELITEFLKNTLKFRVCITLNLHEWYVYTSP